MKRKLRIKKPAALIIAFVLGSLLIPWAMDYADKVRGYDGTGSEFLLPLAFVAAVQLIYMVRPEEKENT
jgi:hypothetical protein